MKIIRLKSNEVKSIPDSQHPDYADLSASWEKWRLTYKGGQDFIDKYLKSISSRETSAEFTERKEYTYCPAFAKAAIDEIKNAIFQRTNDITRKGGSASYLEASKGQKKGVDLAGSTMNTFMGRDVLPEMLTMKKVGVFIDMPVIYGGTMADAVGKRPYIYKYRAEDILNWEEETTDEGTIYTSLLLKDTLYLYDDFGMPVDTTNLYRLCRLVDGQVLVTFYDEDGAQVDTSGETSDAVYTINIPRIPFVDFEINSSLMTDIADYQIALLNLASSDMSYSMKANYPFYVEQFDPRMFTYNRPGGDTADDDTAKTASDQEVITGTMSGRRYPLGTDAPTFIHPSAEPLKASMEKQRELKQEIRQLVALFLTTLEPKMASAESKDKDIQGLEAGLSYIGLELEAGERQIAEIWAMYEDSEISTIRYPQKYSLRTEEERRKEAKDLQEMSANIPSITFKKEIAKEIVDILISHRVTSDTVEKIKTEIDSAKVIDTDPEHIREDLEAGLVSVATASEARGYPKGEVKAAEEDHMKRLTRIAESQSATPTGTVDQARGIADTGDPDDGRKEKELSRNTDLDDSTKKKTRGEGK